MINPFASKKVRDALKRKRDGIADPIVSHVVLPKRFCEALALMRQLGRLHAAVISQDTSTPEGVAVIERLRADCRSVGNDMEAYLKECGRIQGLLNESDDYSLTIDSLTDADVAKAIE